MNILDAIFYQIGNEQYLESKTLFDQMLKMPKIEEEFKDIFDDYSSKYWLNHWNFKNIMLLCFSDVSKYQLGGILCLALF